MYKTRLRGLIPNVMRIHKQWRDSLEASKRASGLSSTPLLGDECILIGFLFNKQLILQKDILMSDTNESQTSKKSAMRENIISLLVKNVNLSQDKAEQVFDIAMTYIKEHPHQLLVYVNNLRTGGATKEMRNFFN
jgi:hypothetical protein